MLTLEVNLGSRSYSILIGPGLLDRAASYREHLSARQLLIVTDDNVAPLYLQRVQGALAGREVTTVVVPAGEASKTLAHWANLLDRLVENGFHRDCAVVALGGGVVGDLAGFAAACYQRGVGFVQMPTTLLAQVDSAVGGKTGVNHAQGKNLIGAFYQPYLVLADTDTLRTLPERELRAGLAEVIKYGAIMDADFFAWLENSLDALLALDSGVLSQTIKRCCEMKAQIVAADELEHGIRGLLNFGHTFGHAIENCAGYGRWLHGEAVSIGMAMAAEFSVGLGLLDAAAATRLNNLLERAGLPLTAPDLKAEDLYAAMALDKKVLAGQLRLVLLDQLGAARLVTDFESAKLRDFLSKRAAA